MVSWQRHLGSGEVHLVSGQDGRLVSGPQVVVELGGGAGVLHLAGLDPAHLDSVHQLRHLLLFQQRWYKAALVLWPIGDRVEHYLAAEHLHLGLEEEQGVGTGSGGRGQG